MKELFWHIKTRENTGGIEVLTYKRPRENNAFFIDANSTLEKR